MKNERVIPGMKVFLKLKWHSCNKSCIVGMKAEFLESGIRAIKIFFQIILNGNTIYKNEGVIIKIRNYYLEKRAILYEGVIIE